MKKSVIKFFDKILILLLGFLGIFNSCIKLMYGVLVPEYGVPRANYELKGVITDKETSNPIPNIRVIQRRLEFMEYGDTLYTDAEGKYTFNYDRIFPSNTFLLKIEDIDDDENGGFFKTQEIDIEFTETDRVQDGNGHWYEGKFAKTRNIELEKIRDYID